MQIKEILELERGYVIELDKLASEPVDIFVNNKKIAEGEVVVIDKHFGIRIVNLIDVNSRLKGL
jgi:flagellar motor switch protein FliN/FliY